MIKPDDLIALADRLAAINGEAEGRAAVSRAYYGAFHAVRSLIAEDCGVVLPGGPEVHRKLHFCLEQSQDADVIEIGDRLQSLRDQRNRADYNLGESKFASRANVQAQIKAAKDIVAQATAATKRVTTFRMNVRAYASSVLKLRLQTV